MSSPDDVLDLDAIVPPSRKIKINNQIIEVFPLSIQQLVVVVKLESQLVNIKSEDEIMPLIRHALGPVIPEILKEDFVLQIPQMRRLIRFAQEISTVEVEDQEVKNYQDPKKKDSLAEELPFS